MEEIAGKTVRRGKFRAIALATVLFFYLSPFVLAQDAQQTPTPGNTAPATTDSNPSAPGQDGSASPAADASPPPLAADKRAAAQGQGTVDKQRIIKSGSKDDINEIERT